MNLPVALAVGAGIARPTSPSRRKSPVLNFTGQPPVPDARRLVARDRRSPPTSVRHCRHCRYSAVLLSNAESAPTTGHSADRAVPRNARQARTLSPSWSASSNDRPARPGTGGRDQGARLPRSPRASDWGIIGPMMKIALDEIPPFSMRVSEPHARRPYLDVAFAAAGAAACAFPRLRTFAHLCAASFFNIVAFSVLIPFAADQCRDPARRHRGSTPCRSGPR